MFQDHVNTHTQKSKIKYEKHNKQSKGDNTFMGRTAQLALSTENDMTPIGKEIKDFVFKVSIIAFALGNHKNI